MKIILALFLWLSGVFRSASCLAQSTATLRGVDLYRSGIVTLERLKTITGPQLDSYVRLRNKDRGGAEKAAAKLKAQIESDIRKLASFAFVNLHYAEYVNSAERNAYITLDIVDAKEAKARMPFRPAPKGRIEDPGGLIEAWGKYTDMGMNLRRQGLLSSERPNCPAFYCLWGSPTPELYALEKIFVQKAGPQQEFLKEVLAKDADPRRRAAALYILSYLNDPKVVTDLLMKSLEDPGEEVRGAALQILSDIAVYRKSVFIEINRIISLLDYPTTRDRGNTLALLVALADNPAYRPYILTRATPYLLSLLKLEQPGNHDLAFTLLSMLAQESYDRRDYASWEKWIEAQKSTATTLPPPALR